LRPAAFGLRGQDLEIVVRDQKDLGPSRRELFRKGAAAAAGLAVAGVAFGATPAAAKMSQKAVMYQPKPQGAQSCAKCTRFVPGKPATADGTCTIVDGNISPQGWCAMYVAKT
jgi:hypothetical protein